MYGFVETGEYRRKDIFESTNLVIIQEFWYARLCEIPFLDQRNRRAYVLFLENDFRIVLCKKAVCSIVDL